MVSTCTVICHCHCHYHFYCHCQLLMPSVDQRERLLSLVLEAVCLTQCCVSKHSADFSPQCHVDSGLTIVELQGGQCHLWRAIKEKALGREMATKRHLTQSTMEFKCAWDIIRIIFRRVWGVPNYSLLFPIIPNYFQRSMGSSKCAWDTSLIEPPSCPLRSFRWSIPSI